MNLHHLKTHLGFTLTELLVSMTILSGLIVLLFAVVDGTTKTWNQSEQRVDAFREARAALFVISRDLQTVISAPDLGPVPYPTPTPTPSGSPAPTPTPVPTPDGTPDFKSFFVNPDRTGTTDVTFAGVAEDTYGDRLFFLTAQPTNAQTASAKSDVCSVGYYLDYTAPPTANIAAPSTFKLFRHYKESDGTYNKIKDYTAIPPVSPTLMQANSSTDEVLARNVVDFRVKAYDATMTNIVPWDPKVTPYAMDISITAYNYSTANRFLGKADWMNFTSTKNAPSRQTFTTRVYLPHH